MKLSEVLRITLLLCLPCALMTGLLAALLPEFALDGSMAAAALLLSDIGGTIGTPILIVALCILLGWVGPRGQRVTEGLLVFFVLSAGIAAQAWLNESLIKETVREPRPCILLLHEAGLIEDVEAFYSMSKPARRARLEWIMADGDREIPGVDTSAAVRAHYLHEAGFSFPSGHTLAAFSVCAFFLFWGLLRMGPRKLWTLTPLLLFAIGMGLARNILRVHTPLDVGVGGVLGSLSGAGLGMLVGSLGAGAGRRPWRRS